MSPKSTPCQTPASVPDPWLPTILPIASIRDEAPRVRTFEFERPGDFDFHPGQFNMLYLPGYGEAAISISSAPGGERLCHTVRQAGNVTNRLFQLPIGARVGLRGPFGTAWPLARYRGWDVVLAAGGIGLAPLRPAVYAILQDRDAFGRVCLIYGTRTPRDLLFADEFDQWRAGGVDVEVTVDFGDPSWHGPVGVVTMLLDQIPWLSSRTTVWTCGPEIMMRFVARQAHSAGVRRSHTYLSMERNMNCAMGFCGHCQFGPAFVCKDGPVFAYPQIAPYLFAEDF